MTFLYFLMLRTPYDAECFQKPGFVSGLSSGALSWLCAVHSQQTPLGLHRLLPAVGRGSLGSLISRQRCFLYMETQRTHVKWKVVGKESKLVKCQIHP